MRLLISKDTFVSGYLLESNLEPLTLKLYYPSKDI